MFLRSVGQVACLLALGSLGCLGKSAQELSERVPVSREQVAQAMQSAGIETTPDQVQVLTNVTTSSGATLRVSKVKESADGILAELACGKPRQCLPFYAMVHSDAAAVAKLPVVPSPGTTPKESPLIARGQSVTLVIQHADFRIVLPAICLESGIQGQTIRVASPDRKRIYTAEVVSNKIVRSTL